MDQNVKKMVYLALLTALCTAATMAIPIPTPGGGYLNAGDIVVVFTALLTGPVCGAVVSAFGSALADLFAGFAIYAPGTFLTKGAAALVIGLLFRYSSRRGAWAAAIAAIIGELVMVIGYFAYEALFLGFGQGAAAGIPANILQAVAGVSGGLLLYHALMRIPQIRLFSERTMKKKK